MASSTSALVDIDAALQGIEDQIRKSRQSLIIQHQDNDCDLNSVAFRTVWSKYKALALQYTRKTMAFNQLLSKSINDAAEQSDDPNPLNMLDFNSLESRNDTKSVSPSSMTPDVDLSSVSINLQNPNLNTFFPAVETRNPSYSLSVKTNGSTICTLTRSRSTSKLKLHSELPSPRRPRDLAVTFFPNQPNHPNHPNQLMNRHKRPTLKPCRSVPSLITLDTSRRACTPSLEMTHSDSSSPSRCTSTSNASNASNSSNNSNSSNSSNSCTSPNSTNSMGSPSPRLERLDHLTMNRSGRARSVLSTDSVQTALTLQRGHSHHSANEPSLSSPCLPNYQSLSLSPSASSRCSTMMGAPGQYSVKCLCGRCMYRTRNPQHKYPPNAVLRCMSSDCKQTMLVGKDWFYFCRSKTSDHDTKDGRYILCTSCAQNRESQRGLKRAQTARARSRKNQRNQRNQRNFRRNQVNRTRKARRSHAKSPHKLQVSEGHLIADIAANSKRRSTHSNVVKEGFMLKRGSWNKTFKRRYFVLMDDRRLTYYGRYDDRSGMAYNEKGVVDLKDARKVEIVEENVIQITTPSREWQFMCQSKTERNAWFLALQQAQLS